MSKDLTFAKQILNGTVDSYLIKQYESGIIQLLINTTDKWVDYHRYNNNEYGIQWKIVDDEYAMYLEIPELVIPDNYICTEHQEKDQISFYWIPKELVCSGKIKEHIISKRNKS